MYAEKSHLLDQRCWLDLLAVCVLVRWISDTSTRQQQAAVSYNERIRFALVLIPILFVPESRLVNVEIFNIFRDRLSTATEPIVNENSDSCHTHRPARTYFWCGQRAQHVLQINTDMSQCPFRSISRTVRTRSK